MKAPLTFINGCDTLFSRLENKRSDEESSLRDILQRNPVGSLMKDQC
jgi:hypothetical protein